MLIPQFQSNGAAIGTIAAEFSVMIIQVVAVRKSIPVVKYVAGYIPVLISGFFMMCIVKAIGTHLESSIITLIVQVGIGGLVFCILLLVFFVISNDELWVMMKRMIGNYLNTKKLKDENKA